jgi:hypothetical protein
MRASIRGHMFRGLQTSIRAAVNEHNASIVAGIVMVFVASVSSTAVYASDFVSTIDKLKTSIAPVVCMKVENQQVTGIRAIDGTGIFVDGNGTFLTAGHVVNDFLPSGTLSDCSAPAVYMPSEGKWHAPPLPVTWYKFAPTACFLDKANDIAECKTVQDLSKASGFHPAEFVVEDEIQPDGTPVAFSGFPLSNAFPLTAEGNIAGYLFNGNKQQVVIDRTNWPGASGSPIYLENGHVVGMILSRGTGVAEGVSLAATGIAIHSFINSSSDTGSISKQPVK